MSSQRDPPKPEDEKQDGFSKYLKRIKTVMRKSSTARSSTSSMQPSTGQLEVSKTIGPSSTSPTPARNPATKSSPQPVVVTHWSAIQQEKARALFAKYGLTLEPGEWQSPSDMTVQRVAKPIRMRVRRTCHRCETTFGPEKVCVNCQHVRCTKCPRHPSTKPKDQAQSALQKIVASREPEPARHTVKGPQVTIPSRTGGQDLVYKPIRQRIRRTCHRCCTTFPDKDAVECPSCKHIRCKKCPREPHKPDKYPDGYPGDAEPPKEIPEWTWKKPRQRVRYSCHKCLTLYGHGQKACANCGQEKGPETIRDPPKKHKPEPDPDVVKRVEERLAHVGVTSGLAFSPHVQVQQLV
ncbi:uncharacterized protein ACLA_014240 [Aspergillus clavatus NRRL 1]|uniref:Uncharacterized protein n=1 Tax=Aspergillus clavatus (strain ATCC 1007 / CBS 513.65 / DSM 816 / NCTC 3887 / NRRL 1 / QM 1276 / 107) TaxID=344612 RepID=A1CB69_ASPCL|nr:uncharacterized protein ACLA_014240 [Aspergillus clavatus NRRL 1]EAW12987.1 conserved hypothetical protein [Aspergillus clavatus NRRL 1]